MTASIAPVLAAGPVCQPADADLFTGPGFDESEPVRQAREARAKAICHTCPARPECLDYGLALQPTEGVWAGYTAWELYRLSYLLKKVA
ncbi:WhiB family transcriptional regulator [Nonomuraea sp. NPDC050663]|uniref:WhiB family transcriptional regulator n=1 Tax=Nonomuraea sp. NPDC050663 TaxID=3364370 RepID=UPI00378D488B